MILSSIFIQILKVELRGVSVNTPLALLHPIRYNLRFTASGITLQNNKKNPNIKVSKMKKNIIFGAKFP
jgi:hypothetical protein